MAEDKDGSKDVAPNEADDAKKGGIMAMLTKMPVIVGGVMTVEAVILFAVLKGFGGGPAPADAHGEVLLDDHGNPIEIVEDKTAQVEVPVDAFRAQNQLDGRTYLYDVEVSILVKPDVAEKVQETLAASTGLVRDRLTRVIRSIDPQKLNGSAEPGLETLRRQVKYQLDLIVGDGLIEEVLVPRCIPYRTSY
jgi:flagellar basal body-associated protein FliL